MKTRPVLVFGCGCATGLGTAIALVLVCLIWWDKLFLWWVRSGIPNRENQGDISALVAHFQKAGLNGTYERYGPNQEAGALDSGVYTIERDGDKDACKVLIIQFDDPAKAKICEKFGQGFMPFHSNSKFVIGFLKPLDKGKPAIDEAQKVFDNSVLPVFRKF